MFSLNCFIYLKVQSQSLHSGPESPECELFLSSEENDNACLRTFVYNFSSKTQTYTQTGTQADIETVPFRKKNKLILIAPSEEMLFRHQDVFIVKKERMSSIRRKQNLDETHKTSRAMTSEPVQSQLKRVNKKKFSPHHVDNDLSVSKSDKPKSGQASSLGRKERKSKPLSSTETNVTVQTISPRNDEDITSKTIDQTAVSPSIKALGRIPKKRREEQVITQSFG